MNVLFLPLPVGRGGCGKFAVITDDAETQSFRTVNCTLSPAKDSEPTCAESKASSVSKVSVLNAKAARGQDKHSGSIKDLSE